VNPEPVFKWVKKYLHHPDKEIRREICHGMNFAEGNSLKIFYIF